MHATTVNREATVLYLHEVYAYTTVLVATYFHIFTAIYSIMRPATTLSLDALRPLSRRAHHHEGCSGG